MPEPPNEQTRFVSTDADPGEGVGGAAASKDDWTPPADDDPIFDEISEAVRVFGEKYPHEEHLWPESWRDGDRDVPSFLQNEIGTIAARRTKDIMIDGDPTVETVAPLLWYALHPRSVHNETATGFLGMLSADFDLVRIGLLWMLKRPKAAHRLIGLIAIDGPSRFMRSLLIRCLHDRASVIRNIAADDMTAYMPDREFARLIWRQAKKEKNEFQREMMRDTAMSCRFGYALGSVMMITNSDGEREEYLGVTEVTPRGNCHRHLPYRLVKEHGLREGMRRNGQKLMTMEERLMEMNSPCFAGALGSLYHHYLDQADDRDALKPDLERWMAEHQACPRLAKSDWSRLIGPHRPYLDKHIVDYSIFAYHRWCDEQDKKRAARSK